MNTLQICPPNLSDVATLPRKIKKVIFNPIIHILQIIYVSSEENEYQLLFYSFSCLLIVVYCFLLPA